MIGPLLQRTGEALRVGPDAQAPADALGLLEVTSIARGHVVADAMCKRAPVELVLARPVSPGKHLTLVIGGVADVEEAMRAGVEVADDTLVDRLDLAQVATQVISALRSQREILDDNAVGVIETFSVASTLLAADAACKAAHVRLAALRLADGIGGKAFFTVQGDQADVEAALFAAESIIKSGLLAGRELIARPHESLIAELRRG
jgi:microcompartment protein CcmL/EutN